MGHHAAHHRISVDVAGSRGIRLRDEFLCGPFSLLTNEQVEIAPLAYMRGRNLADCAIIADEMQNSTISQTKMVLTRIADNSRIIVTGDLQQHDRGYDVNGIADFIERLKRFGSRGIALIEFGATDVVRHPIIEDILRLYGD